MIEQIKAWCVTWGLALARYGGWSEALVIEPILARATQAFDRVAAERDALMVQLSAMSARMATSATVRPEVFERAVQVVADADTLLHDGEAKRHYAYARLIKDFPAAPRRELGLAIELVLARKEG